MKSENKVWKSKFLGELDESIEIYRNTNNNEMKFKIKIISSGPSDFPNETIKVVNGFSESLRMFGYFDHIEDDDDVRKQKIIKFLQENYMIFSVRESEHSNPFIDQKYYNAMDLKVISKESSGGLSATFETIPLIKVDKGNVQSYINKIMNEEYVGKNDSISYHKDDLPPFLLIYEASNTSLEGAAKYYVIGPFSELQHNDEYGIKFLVDEPPKWIELNKRELSECYLSQDGVAFVTTEDCYKIEEKLHKSPKVEGISTKPKGIKETRKIEDIDESKFLSRFEDTCKSKGLVYKTQDLYNFHTAMKTQGFVILSGMSGTGKSQLVQCYYESLSQSKSEENLLFIPVSPSWQDDTDLLGYLDTLNSIYRPGDSGLVDFIIESTQRPQECFIICLDEMNLAKVEHYFSQFLSILERDLDKRNIYLYNPKIEDRVFNKNDYRSEIKLGENLLFVGTINTDESTFSFSDKVLDRANVISLGLRNFVEIKKELKEYKEGNIDKENLIESKEESKDTFTKFQGMKKNDKKNELNDAELEFLWSLHAKLNKVNPNIGVGMRILNQIERYLINLPESTLFPRNVAFDLQISQRIFTKIRGSRTQLDSLVGKESEGNLIDSEIMGLFENNKDISNFDYSIEKLKNISRELAEYGHTI